MSFVCFAQQTFVQSTALAVFGLVGFLAIVFWLWMAVDCLLHEPPSSQRSAWLLVLLLGSWIGALFYFFIRRGERRRQQQLAAALPTKSSIAYPDAAAPKPPPLVSQRGWSPLFLVAMLLAVCLVPIVGTVLLGIGAMFVLGYRAQEQVQQATAESVASAAAADARFEEARRRHEAMFEQAQAEFERRRGQFKTGIDATEDPFVPFDGPTGEVLTSGEEVRIGEELWGEWGGLWNRVQVVEALADGQVKVHWIGWDAHFDETLPRSRLKRAVDP